MMMESGKRLIIWREENAEENSPDAVSSATEMSRNYVHGMMTKGNKIAE
jgi:hypothetical protein